MRCSRASVEWLLGQCSLAVSEPLQGFTSPKMAEAFALWRVVTVAKDHSYDKVIFDSGCLSLISKTKSISGGRYGQGHQASGGELRIGHLFSC
jgi:hypothetical protein